MINPPSTNFAEQWVKQYAQLNKAISYKSFDFNGIKRSLIEYLRTYHPEYFNNLTETDELLPLIEMFAYVGELYAYRADVNSQEHILATTTRKSSAIQIANMLGYTPSRRVGGIGLVKITSVSTTESINDVSGSNLQRRVIKWGDPTNPRWKSQFELVMGRVLNTSVGISAASDKTQVDNITFERHVMNTSPLINGVFKYNIIVNGVSVPMELVSTALESGSITEQRPIGVRPLDLLYANDGFGDASPTSGYMFLTKQGTLSSQLTSFDGGTVNLTFTGSAVGINDTDVWLNAVNADRTFKSNWLSVDNIAYNDNTSGDVFQIVSLENDQVTLVFGDGNYANVPVGSFEMWHRVSMELENPIPVSAINNQQFAVEYLDIYGNTQTFSCTFTLSSPIVNGSASESLDKLKQSIPGVFYTQDRMVNANDHQTYLLQDPSIVKVKAVNRTFAGHSKYSGWYDSGEVYENVKIFSDDGVLYFEPNVKYNFVNSSISSTEFITQHLEPSLLYPELWNAISYRTNADVSNSRTYLSTDERASLTGRISGMTIGSIVSLQWDTSANEWLISGESASADLFFVRGNAKLNAVGSPELVDAAMGWTIFSHTYRTVIQSSSTRFWQYSSLTTQDYDTLHPTNDTITVLKANLNKSRTGNMSVDTVLKISNNVSFLSTLSNQSSKDLSRVEVTDANVNIGVRGLVNTEYSVLCPTDSALTIRLPQSFIVSAENNGYADLISIKGCKFDSLGNVTNIVTFAFSEFADITSSAGKLSYSINLPSLSRGGIVLNPGVDSIIVNMRDYVYFERASADYQFEPLGSTDSAKMAYTADISGNVCRYMGRDGINFLWQHFTSDFELINPARTNITDLYVIPKQYFTQYMRWLRESTLSKPEIPTSTQLHTAYSKYLQKSMMSDELVLRPGKFRPLFGPKSEPALRAKIQVIVAAGVQIANDAIKQEIVTLTRKYFDISNVEFGDTFYFSNLSSYLHSSSRYELGSVLLIPLYPGYKFGDLYELTASPDEVFVADINVTDVQIVDQLSSTQIRQ